MLGDIKRLLGQYQPFFVDQDRPCYELDGLEFVLHGNCWSLDQNISKRTWIFTPFFRNVPSPLRNKDITAFLRHPEQCLIPSPQIDFCFTNLSRLFLEIFKFFEKYAQNLNTPQNNSASWIYRWDLIRYAKG